MPRAERQFLGVGVGRSRKIGQGRAAIDADAAIKQTNKSHRHPPSAHWSPARCRPIVVDHPGLASRSAAGAADRPFGRHHLAGFADRPFGRHHLAADRANVKRRNKWVSQFIADAAVAAE